MFHIICLYIHQQEVEKCEAALRRDVMSWLTALRNSLGLPLSEAKGRGGLEAVDVDISDHQLQSPSMVAGEIVDDQAI